MAMQPPFFGKRPADVVPARTPTGQPGSLAGSGSPGGSVGGSAPPAPVTGPMAGAASTVTAPLSGAPTKEGGSKLTVGPNIKLKGVETIAQTGGPSSTRP